MVLTHCNTGSLACSGFGTALGVVRTLHGMGRLRTAYCTETRPYNQVGINFGQRIGLGIIMNRPEKYRFQMWTFFTVCCCASK